MSILGRFFPGNAFLQLMTEELGVVQGMRPQFLLQKCAELLRVLLFGLSGGFVGQRLLEFGELFAAQFSVHPSGEFFFKRFHKRPSTGSVVSYEHKRDATSRSRSSSPKF